MALNFKELNVLLKLYGGVNDYQTRALIWNLIQNGQCVSIDKQIDKRGFTREFLREGNNPLQIWNLFFRNSQGAIPASTYFITVRHKQT